MLAGGSSAEHQGLAPPSASFTTQCWQRGACPWTGPRETQSRKTFHGHNILHEQYPQNFNVNFSRDNGTLSETGDGSGLKLPTLILLCSAKPTINWSKDLLIGGSAKRLYCVFPAKESQLKVYSSFYHPSKIIRTLMIRGRRRRVHLINVSVLPRLCLVAASPACDVWSSAQTRQGRGKQVSRATRGGGSGSDQSNPDTGIRSAGQGQDETLKYHQ